MPMTTSGSHKPLINFEDFPTRRCVEGRTSDQDTPSSFPWSKNFPYPELPKGKHVDAIRNDAKGDARGDAKSDITHFSRYGEGSCDYWSTTAGAALSPYENIRQLHDRLKSDYARLKLLHEKLVEEHSRSFADQGDRVKLAAARKTVYAMSGAIPSNRADSVKYTHLAILRLEDSKNEAILPPKHLHNAESFDYAVSQYRLNGLTEQMCKSGTMDPIVREEFINVVREVDRTSVRAICCNYGHSVHFQELARKHTKKPVFFTALSQLLALSACFKNDRIVILTYCVDSLLALSEVVKKEFNINLKDPQYTIVGCNDVPGLVDFPGAPAVGKVDEIANSLMKKVEDAKQKDYLVKVVLLESAGMTPYAQAIRVALNMPVYDLITAANFYVRN